jgi:carbamoyl-phosphate synthase large subunit
MAGESLDEAVSAYGGMVHCSNLKHIAVKEAVFPFSRFPGVDTLLGPEMRSTGEVMGIDFDYPMAFAKAQLGAGSDLPRHGTVFVSVRDADKERVLPAVTALAKADFRIMATSGTSRYLNENGIQCVRINKVLEGHPHIEDAIRNRQVQMVINTTEGRKAVSDSKSLRLAALLNKVPYFTTIAGATAAGRAVAALQTTELTVRPLQDYFR